MESVRLGTGILSWDADERRSDRYGSVKLHAKDAETTAGDATEPLPDGLPVGAYGRLVATVTEQRPSPHIGDLFRGIFPPKDGTPVGTHLVLGTGWLFLEKDNAVGVEPVPERDADWLNPDVLYQLHYQTVDLWFELAT